MSPAHLAPEDEDAIELLVGKFTLCPSDSRTLLHIVERLRLTAPQMSQQTTWRGTSKYV